MIRVLIQSARVDQLVSATIKSTISYFGVYVISRILVEVWSNNMCSI